MIKVYKKMSVNDFINYVYNEGSNHDGEALELLYDYYLIDGEDIKIETIDDDLINLQETTHQELLNYWGMSNKKTPIDFIDEIGFYIGEYINELDEVVYVFIRW